ncbi:hypothetical protein HPB48_002126 [Haemaphysalis longicornis]|uniref:Uncharacterized protein n=1 Tax=Haemaphysalis longicornis TaxID=44386 RepID=A0A9J6FJQ2_HAELO|nr:hypothetical protein HPB48_002126 [Haemaphysalis longicornis]
MNALTMELVGREKRGIDPRPALEARRSRGAARVPNQEGAQAWAPGACRAQVKGPPAAGACRKEKPGSRGAACRMPAANAGADSLSCPLGRVSASSEATEKGDGLVGVAALISGDAVSGGPPAGPGEDMSPAVPSASLHAGRCLLPVCSLARAGQRSPTGDSPSLGRLPAKAPRRAHWPSAPLARGGATDSAAFFHAFGPSRPQRQHLPRLSRASSDAVAPQTQRTALALRHSARNRRCQPGLRRAACPEHRRMESLAEKFCETAFRRTGLDERHLHCLLSHQEQCSFATEKLTSK